MAVFIMQAQSVEKLRIKKFKNEKQLQQTFENSLEEIFGIRFLASEFTTTHGGRIDTRGLDEDGSPVIIEYKEVVDPQNKLVDISEKGHWATGDLKLRIESNEDIEYCMDIVKQSYESKL